MYLLLSTYMSHLMYILSNFTLKTSSDVISYLAPSHLHVPCIIAWQRAADAAHSSLKPQPGNTTQQQKSSNSDFFNIFTVNKQLFVYNLDN